MERPLESDGRFTRPGLGPEAAGGGLRRWWQQRGAPALTVELPPQLVDAVAERVVELLAERGLVGQPEDPWLTIDEAAAYMHCKRQRVYDLRSARELVGAHDGGRPVHRRSELDAYLERRGGTA